MRHHVARRFIQLLAFVALAFTVDTIIQAGVSATAVIAVAFVGIGFAVLIVRLAHGVLHGHHGRRRAAIVGLNVVATIPVLAVLPVVMTLDSPAVIAALRAALVWMLVTMIWTTLVIAAGVHRADMEAPAERPARRRGRTAHSHPRPAGIR